VLALVAAPLVAAFASAPDAGLLADDERVIQHLDLLEELELLERMEALDPGENGGKHEKKPRPKEPRKEGDK
jgi:hypothetical protein